MIEESLLEEIGLDTLAYVLPKHRNVTSYFLHKLIHQCTVLNTLNAWFFKRTSSICVYLVTE